MPEIPFTVLVFAVDLGIVLTQACTAMLWPEV